MIRQFTDEIGSEAALREIIGMPNVTSVAKEIDYLDKHAQKFISLAPFALMGTADASGRCDVSPRGDGPGFVHVLDEHTMAIPDRPGNKRVDSLVNILENPHIGMLFMIPNVEETLRVNGRASLVRDLDILEPMTERGKLPLLAIVVDVEEVYLQCAKALKRSELWKPETWPERSELPSLAQMILDQSKLCDRTVEEYDAAIEESYKTRLY